MTAVKQLLRNKGQTVWAIGPDDTVHTALQLMADKNIGALPVTKDNQLVGIFSERDYVRKVCLQGKVDLETRVGEFMTERVFTITPEHTIEQCMATMTEKHIRHLPVMSAGQLAGIISIGDVVKEVLSDREFTIRQLERYITGGYTG